jgi:hypothetical protein
LEWLFSYIVFTLIVAIMLLPFAFVIIAVFIILAIVLIVRKSNGKKELNRNVVSKERVEEAPPREHQP